jgi:hypothetical protein
MVETIAFSARCASPERMPLLARRLVVMLSQENTRSQTVIAGRAGFNSTLAVEPFATKLADRRLQLRPRIPGSG